MNFAARTVILSFIVATSFCLQAFAQEAPSAVTKDFIQKASIGNQFEIVSSQLAVKRATMPEVKDFALMMIADHTKIGDALKQTLADRKLGLLPAKNLDTGHQKTLDGLKSASAASFDGLYILAQTDAHDNAVSLFKNYAQNGDNDDLKKFAADTLPKLEQHQEKIQSLNQTTVSTK